MVLAARQRGVKLGLIRPITLWPFPQKAFDGLAGKIKGIMTLELNAGQMIEDVKLAVSCAMPVELYSRQGGMLPSETDVLLHFLRPFMPELRKEA